MLRVGLDIYPSKRSYGACHLSVAKSTMGPREGIILPRSSNDQLECHHWKIGAHDNGLYFIYVLDLSRLNP